MSRLLIVTQPALAIGFHLAGVDAFAVEDAEGAQDLIGSWLDSGEDGLLAIDEDLLVHMEPRFVRRLEVTPQLPLLAIPSGGRMGFEGSRRQRIAEMIRRAIGFHITFKGEEAEVDQ